MVLCYGIVYYIRASYIMPEDDDLVLLEGEVLVVLQPAKSEPPTPTRVTGAPDNQFRQM